VLMDGNSVTGAPANFYTLPAQDEDS